MKAQRKKNKRLNKKSPTKTRGTPRPTSRRAKRKQRPDGKPALPEVERGEYKPALHGAFVIYLDRKQRVLVGRQAEKHKPKRERQRRFTLPGGGLERGEDFAVAALEELGEETGLFSTVRRLRQVGTMKQRVPKMPHAQGVVAVFEHEDSAALVRQTDGELEDLQFMSIEEALDRRDEFLPTMLRVMWLAHARRNAPGAPNFIGGHIGHPIYVARPKGRKIEYVCI